MKRIFFISLFFICISFQNFPQVNSKLYLENAVIMDIKEDPEFIWVATYGYGIFKFSKEDEKWTNYSTKSNNLENDLFYTIEVNNKYVWAGSSQGLFIYNKKKDKWTKKRFSQGGEWGNWIRSLYFDDSENILWIGRFINLTTYDLKQNKYFDYDKTIEGNPRTNNFKVIKADGDSLIWFGTEAGIHIYEKKKNISDKSAWRFISNKDGFNNDAEAISISDILFENNYVWIAAEEFITSDQPEFNVGGIYRYDRRSHWDKLSKKTGLPANGIYCLEKCGNEIWTTLYSFDKNEKHEYGKGMVLIDRFSGRASVIDLNETNISTSKILCLHFDGKNMWAGTDEGLLKIQIYNPLAAWSGTKNVENKSSRKYPKKNNNSSINKNSGW